MDPLKAKANFTRICQLLIDKGSDALRRALYVIHPAPTLAAALHSHRSTLQRLRYTVINPPQWRLLYPAAGPPNSNEFDITLLTILLRNICGLSSPATGWNVIPPKTDTSISADILRIKIFRNEVYGHTASAQYDDATFEKLWQEISQPLVKLGIPQQEIDELKVVPLSPEEKSYIEKLKEWKELEDTLLEKMKDFESQMVDMRAEVKKLKGTLSGSNISNLDQLTKFDFRGRIDGLCEKFQVNTRQWFFDKLSTWFADEESRVMILTGGPGIGKSVLSAKVCKDYSERGKLAGGHFSDFRKSNYSKPSNIIESLASQMCDNVDGFREKLTEILGRNHSRDSLSDAFTVLLSEPLHALDRHEPMLIVMDALDESKTDDKSEFLELISDEFPDLPKWIKIRITSRPELQVKKKLEHFNALEILPQDENQQKDLKCFVKGSLPHFEVDSIDFIVRKCEGSFLYAYYMVKELKEVDAGIEPNLRDYAPRGISGFYERQFTRLRTGLQPHDPGILKAFINVVAASSGAPLPIKILLKCMNLSNEKYEIRSTIINMMSEILPVYDNYLTTYHKSLMDWFTLEGYEEHEFAADVTDGTKRLWEVCKSIYRDIDSMISESDFELSLESEFALENGGKYLVDVGDTVDFHWLINIRLNALKLCLYGGVYVDYYHILNHYKSALCHDVYWRMMQHCSILEMIEELYDLDCESYLHCFYLQSIANAHFQFATKSFSSQTPLEYFLDEANEAKHILDDLNEIWLEQLVNVESRDYEVIESNAIFSDGLNCFVSSPDNNLLVCAQENSIKVLKLPSLVMIFELKLDRKNYWSKSLTFSPDSSYFLYNSITSCVCVAKKKEVRFIPQGPEMIDSCSFSSCGMKLVTTEYNFFKVWDVKERKLLAQVETFSSVKRCVFSSCSKYILTVLDEKLFLWDLTKLEGVASKNICFDTCLKCKDNFQILTVDLPYFTGIFRTYHFHLPNDQIVVVVPNNTPEESFTWRNKECLISVLPSTLEMFDVKNQEVIDRFQIGCFPPTTDIDCISKLEETKFLCCLNSGHVLVLSLKTSQETSVVSCVNSFLQCVTVSPDHLYAACCYENCVLTIKNVDNGETLQTVELQKPPEACWWSELYLWVVCKDVVLKFPYHSANEEILESDPEECAINFDRVLKFDEGVLVFEVNDENGEKICISKICDDKLIISQPLASSTIGVSCVTVSSDACAVLLFRKSVSEYQLWEFARESGWELQSAGRFRNFKTIECDVLWFSLVGTRSDRSSMWLSCENDIESDTIPYYYFSFFDLSGEAALDECSRLLLSTCYVHKVCYVEPNHLLIFYDQYINVFNLSSGEMITVLYFKNDWKAFLNASIFYLSSKGLLTFVFPNNIKCFKIHNL